MEGFIPAHLDVLFVLPASLRFLSSTSSTDFSIHLLMFSILLSEGQQRLAQFWGVSNPTRLQRASSLQLRKRRRRSASLWRRHLSTFEPATVAAGKLSRQRYWNKCSTFYFSNDTIVLNCNPLTLDGGSSSGVGDASSPIFHLPAEFFHPAAAAHADSPRDTVSPGERGPSRLASPASWASLRSPGANSRPLSSQVPKPKDWESQFRVDIFTSVLHNQHWVDKNIVLWKSSIGSNLFIYGCDRSDKVWCGEGLWVLC